MMHLSHEASAEIYTIVWADQDVTSSQPVRTTKQPQTCGGTLSPTDCTTSNLARDTHICEY